MQPVHLYKHKKSARLFIRDGEREEVSLST